MRRLVGLIALAALIYAAVWMIQNDFDLRKVPILSDVISEIETPTSQSVPDQPADAAATLASQAPSDPSENAGTDASSASESPPVSGDGSSTETLASDMAEAAANTSSKTDGQPL